MVTPEEAVASFEQRFGSHDGHRRLHAKGWLYRGSFRATPAATALTSAAVFSGETIPVVARVSNGGGNPKHPDWAPDVRGLAVKFSTGATTFDIVAQTAPRFPVRTLDRMVEFVRANETSPKGFGRLAAFIAKDPRTVLPALVADAKALQPPTSYAEQRYFAVHAFIWVDPDGGRRAVRYTWEPEAGVNFLKAKEAKALGPDYLHDEFDRRLASGPVRFTLRLQVAEPGDRTDDPTVPWPASRPVIDAGTLELVAPETERETKGDILVFDPTRVASGIELSDDPVLHIRSRVYSESVRRRTGVERPADLDA
ncbi:MAG TPA: catalase family peroxidase [Aeromicrobium sp.]|nr:catalase family peroxidase [Aeromicrobium sp.]